VDCKKNGKREDGETLCEDLMPLHPVPIDTASRSISHPKIFQFMLTLHEL
jgi:hypothetical protein